MKLFLSPHNDDAVLFGCFTLLREKPSVLTVYDSVVQATRGHGVLCGARSRRVEDLQAISGVIGLNVYFGGVPDDALNHDRVLECLTKAAAGGYTEVWIPAVEEGGHDQHNLVGQIGEKVFKYATIHRYLSYTRTKGKSTSPIEIKPEGWMVRRKLQAMACYKSQLEIEALGCWPHFMDLREYML